MRPAVCAPLRGLRSGQDCMRSTMEWEPTVISTPFSTVQEHCFTVYGGWGSMGADFLHYILDYFWTGGQPKSEFFGAIERRDRQVLPGSGPLGCAHAEGKSSAAKRHGYRSARGGSGG